ncbi:MAG TPA: hypothetical protein DCE52_12480 [Rhodobacteraceae bacterium]|mgnify:FL=1|nr:hypothetical protein [Paracoccaceae bacterium]
MAESALSVFVKKALASGASIAAIERDLFEAGWSKRQVSKALGEFSPAGLGTQAPKPKPEFRVREIFLYTTMFITLYLSSYHLGSLFFQFVNLIFPDASHTDYGEIIGRNIRFNVSALLVAFPVFLLVAVKIAKHIQFEPLQRASPVRIWLTYLTLAIATCVLAGNFIALLNSFLTGELSIAFILKVLIVAGIAGGLFSYYLWSIRTDTELTAEW